MNNTDIPNENKLDELGSVDEGGGKRKKSKRTLIIIIVAVILLLLAAVRIASSGRDAGLIQQEIAISVSTFEVQEGTLDTHLTLPGRITPKSQIYVVPKIAGKVTALYVELGQWVNKGDLLFSIDKTDVALSLAQAEAAMASAQSAYERTVGGTAEQTQNQLEVALNVAQVNYDTAKNALERTMELYNAGGVSKQALEQAQAAHDLTYQQYVLAQSNYDLTVNKILSEGEKAAKAGLDQANAGYQSALNAYNNTEVRAETSGYIGLNTVVVGGMVSSAQPPMSIVDIREVYAEVGLPESVINKIDGSQTVLVEVPSIANKIFKGTIAGISPVAGAASQTYQAKVVISNETDELKGGMFASVKFRVDTIEDAIYIPVSAVKSSGGETYVFTVGDDMRAQKRAVVLGISNESDTQIISGIKKGDVVVTKGQDFLADGALVEVISGGEAS